MLSPLANLLLVPLSSPELLPLALRELLLIILTVPLLPNRLLPVLTAFSARLPLASINLVPLEIISASQLETIESRIHLLANLTTFMPYKYSSLSPAAFATYLRLCALLMNALPTHALEPPEARTNPALNWADDSDDDEETRVEIVDSFEPRTQLPPLDDRTRKRLLNIPSSDHITSLLRASQNPSLLEPFISFSLGLSTVWPSRRDKVLSTIVAYNRGSLVKEIFRAYVRSSPLGRDDGQADISSK